ncbi:MAG: WD40 repeat domain-containing protein, partial [Anaerolineaceae bacterium]|nr:WD40 repeat domain-containing protein [Anaerolineaceae bacterium]
MADKNKQLIQQPARQQALASVQHFEAETRLACAPEREITPIITCMHSLTMQRYAFTPDDRRVAIANRRVIYILDLQTRKVIQAFDAGEWVEAILVSPDGKFVITGGSDNLVCFRDMYTGVCIRKFSGHQRRILNLALSPDGRWLASGDYNALGIWDLKTGTRHHWFGDLSKDSLKDFAFSADSQTLYLGVGKMARVLDVESGQFIREIPKLQDIHEIAVTPDGRTLITKEGSNFSLRLMDLGTEEERKIENCYSVSSFALSPDGHTLATGHESKLQLWDLRDASRLAVIEDIPPSFSPIVFNSDGSHFIAHGRGLQLYSLATGEIFNLVLREPSRLRCSAFDSNGKVLVTEGPGAAFNVWDLRTGILQAQLIGNTDGSDISYPSGRAFTFSPDGKLLISRANDMMIRVWDIARGKCMQVMEMEKRPKRSMLIVHP